MKSLNLENISETKKRIENLMTEIEKPGCDSKPINELKDILETIGDNTSLLAKYKDIYDDAADALMFAGISADECKCDPLRKHIPTDKID